ncbi:putative jacalin-like lectin domain-containing protein [Helianthus annuus]|nr:putative jacalin-like lectin domain-containing protein [Helianthus annuus]KAJ0655383.1 putative jacalin-like lectin domain-containing protein [Helianthus annuus]KAJ0659078.1 putative jacalin-like lectin domain-containing protein [Helianthus annuus]
MEGVLQNMKPAGFIRVAPWGQPIGDPQKNNWSFEIEEGYKLQSIRIGHADDVITSLTFTTEFRGALSISNKFGSAGAQSLSLVTFDSDEEIVGIKVTFGLKVGFYGNASDWIGGIGGIGVYLKVYGEIMRIGTWGKPLPAFPQTIWSFQLEGNYRLSKITIDHGETINSLMFNSSEKVDDPNGLSIIDHVTLDEDEEIIGISGMVGTLPTRQTIISSISFTTNKKTHGPFGDNVKGTPFSVSWDAGSFAGFYGLHGRYFDSIGVYLKDTN